MKSPQSFGRPQAKMSSLCITSPRLYETCRACMLEEKFLRVMTFNAAESQHASTQQCLRHAGTFSHSNITVLQAYRSAACACLTKAADAEHHRAHLLSGRAARLQTAPLWASTDCSLLEAPTSSTSRVPSLVPTTACLFPGANSAHSPYPASIVRRQAPDLGFQILTSLLDPDSRRESSLDSATVRMSERWPCDSKPCRRLTSSSLMCHTCSQEAAGKVLGYVNDLLAGHHHGEDTSSDIHRLYEHRGRQQATLDSCQQGNQSETCQIYN